MSSPAPQGTRKPIVAIDHPQRDPPTPTGCERIHLTDLIQHKAFQIRHRLDKGTVSRYVAAIHSGAELPPVTVARIKPPSSAAVRRVGGNRSDRTTAEALSGLAAGTPVVIDGFHRCAALELAGRTHVVAKIIEATPTEARWLAAKANMEHGLPLKRSEVFEGFKAFIQAKRYLHPDGTYRSLRDIGREFGKPHQTIRAWLVKGKFRRILSAYAEEEVTKRTHRENEGEDPMEAAYLDVATSLANARLLLPGLSMEQRGELRETTRELLKIIEKLGSESPDF